MDIAERAAGPPAGWRAYVSLLRRNAALRRLFLGEIISYCGDWFLTVALLDLVLRLTQSALLAALMVVCQMLPAFLLAPWAGQIVDQYDRRRLIIVISVAQALLALLPLAVRSTPLLPLAYIALVGIAAGATFVSPAIQSAIPNIAIGDDLVMANVLMGSTWGAMLAIGSALGGAVAAVGGLTAACGADALSFVAVALLLVGIAVPFQAATRHDEPLSVVVATREALRYARRRPRVLALLTCKGGFGIGAGAVVLLSVFGRDVYHDGSFGIGMLYGARGLGALLGPFLVRGLTSDDNARYRAIGVAGIVYGLGYAAFAISPALALACAAITIAHMGGGAQWTFSSYGLQREVPDGIRGRIFAADFALVTLTSSISTLAAGALADAIGPVPTALLGGVAMLAWALIWAAWTRSLWSADPLATATDPAS
jgi:MFS family permease